MPKTLLDKVWDLHTVRTLPSGQTQLFIGLHLVHEATSAQAFQMLRERGMSVARPERTFATVDHVIPTTSQARPFVDAQAETLFTELEGNTTRHGIRLFQVRAPDAANRDQGIVHVIGPEMGLTQPGMTIACGDSHTSTHGAFGSVAFGIGTSQVRDVLASQSLAMSRPRVRRIWLSGKFAPGVYAKDAILAIIGKLGVTGGVGYAYEYAGPAADAMTMEERMTLCNMTIEGGARCGYVNPDATTFAYLQGRQFAPSGAAFERACSWWAGLRSDPDAAYADEVRIDCAALQPMVTWGINPGHVAGVDEPVPAPESLPEKERASAAEALGYMGLESGRPLAGTPIDVAFIGSCTNGRISDLREAARVVRASSGRRVPARVRALVVPGSYAVAAEAEAEGLPEIFRAAGFEWRLPGCSMCLAMNPDKLVGRQLCASSSNRNFKGRQGSASGRTVLMSPAMVAAAALAGTIVDVREILR